MVPSLVLFSLQILAISVVEHRQTRPQLWISDKQCAFCKEIGFFGHAGLDRKVTPSFDDLFLGEEFHGIGHASGELIGVGLIWSLPLLVADFLGPIRIRDIRDHRSR